jgi:hypothetical protein
MSSFCDIRQIKISDQIYLSKPDIFKCNFFPFKYPGQISYFLVFLFGVNLLDIYCYLIVGYQHLGYFVRKMPLRLKSKKQKKSKYQREKKLL